MGRGRLERAVDQSCWRAVPLRAGRLGRNERGAGGILVDGYFYDTFFSGNAHTTILMFMGLGLAAGCRIRAGLRETDEEGKTGRF